MGTLCCETSAGELLMQAGLGFEHMLSYCYSDSRQRVYIVPEKNKNSWVEGWFLTGGQVRLYQVVGLVCAQL